MDVKIKYENPKAMVFTFEVLNSHGTRRSIAEYHHARRKRGWIVFRCELAKQI